MQKTVSLTFDRAGNTLGTALVSGALVAAAAVYSPLSEAGATFKIDDTKWVSIGAGLRTSFSASESAANAQKWSNDFNLDNIRLYLNGQVHKYFKLEFNTECQTCGNGGEMRILDVIGKVEVDPLFNIWMGRMLVPAERREMNGPFYSAVYGIYSKGTPFEPSDYNLTIRNDGTSAGSYGRDDGATFWGSVLDGHLQYAVGFFRGLRGGANNDDNILYAQRFAYNFLDVEKNPGYYTSGTYYGKGGDILTVGVSNQYQEDGAGTITDKGTFRGTAVDVLFEKPLADMGVVTLNGEYKNYGISGYSMASRLAGGGFSMFEGGAYDVSAMYLLPDKVWVGQFQPYIRYVNVDPVQSATRENYEVGLNYIIDSHNAKVMLMYDYGDMATKGLNYTATASGSRVSSVQLGFQLQI
ncbi:MAG: hypothetical protein RLZZ226_2227 [Pseudomonadota bacterium]